MPFYMPPEWAPQAATWISWPTNADTWSQNLELAQQEFVLLVHAIAADQKVCVLCGGEGVSAIAENHLFAQHREQLTTQQINNIELVDIQTNDAWARDYAPTFVKSDDELHSIDWHYNAWGGKYPPYDQDQRVAQRVAKHLGIENHPAGICAEGGALEINGDGVLLITRSSVLNKNRNPDLKQSEVDEVLRQFLGAREIVWLPGEEAGVTVMGDDTDGHIDQLARFTDNQTIVYAWTDDPLDPQRRGLEANRDELHARWQPSIRSATRLRCRCLQRSSIATCGFQPAIAIS